LSDTPLQLKQFLPYQLAKLAQQVSASLAVTYEQRFALTISQWRVLACLGEKGQATSKMIADESFMDKVKTSRAIKELIDRGLLVKQADQADSRSFWLSLSDAGEALYSSVIPYAIDWEEQFLVELSASERENLKAIISKLQASLQQAD
jgi:DNA-binding MarR family transcriptional regulator